jgi:altronate hydrolase
MQETGGTRKTIEAGIAAVKEMLPEANRVSRTQVPASHITVGLQCGGSDGFSSITANPALGAAVDLLVRHGGTAILSETPEIYGVEHTLTRRARTSEVGEKLVERIRWWKEEYTVGRDTQINGRVSPGNQHGGLANIFEKSLGSSMKGGTGPLMEVYRYAEPVRQQGLVFMDTPGFDPCSATGQIAGGRQPARVHHRPRLHVRREARAFAQARDQHAHVPETRRRHGRQLRRHPGRHRDRAGDGPSAIFQQLLRVASGEPTKSELLGLGDHEFVPWMIGVTG